VRFLNCLALPGFDTHKFYILLTKFIEVICVVSDEISVTLLHSINPGFYNGERVCSLHDTN
jgi:hypothetical protein